LAGHDQRRLAPARPTRSDHALIQLATVNGTI